MIASIVDFFPQTDYLNGKYVRLGLVSRIFSGGTPDKGNLDYWEGGDIPWIGSGEVNQGIVQNATSYITRQAVESSATKLFPKDSLIMALAGQGKTKGTVARMGIEAYGNQSLGCISDYRGESRFLYWWLSSLYREIRNLSSQETRDGLNQSMLGQIPVPLIDLATQRQIADFLDRETARIDLLIEKKQRLVALLLEKANTQKLYLVTGQQKGEQKPTKIRWAASIPDHWEERAVWMLFELGRGRVMSHEYIAENKGEYPIYSSQTANDGVMGYINTFDFEGEYLTWTTDGAKAGTVFRRKGRFNCTNVCGTLRPLTRSIDLNYAQVALDTATDFFVRHDINPKLMNGVMSKIRIPYPSFNEQREIGIEIDRVEESLKPLREKTSASVDRLKEYRSALITAAVTGQADVTSFGQSGATDRRLDAIQEEMEA